MFYLSVIFFILFETKIIATKNYYVVEHGQPVIKEDFDANSNVFDTSKKGKAVFDTDVLQKCIKSVNPETEKNKIEDPNKYCRMFDTCFECVKSAWYRCDWCHNYGCTSVGEELCPLSAKEGMSGSKNTTLCPFIIHNAPIFIPSGVRTHIEVKVNVPDPIFIERDIICQIQVTHTLKHLKGLLITDTVYCLPVKLEIVDNTDYGTFNLVWGGVEPYSNEIPLIVYRCESLGKDCETCRMLSSEYGCGWCQEIEQCVVADMCTEMVTWSLNRVTCQFNTKKMFFV